ncbi:hypothetical protein EJ04DRAFT_606202, partial [Polyplosphaeria fusca]
KFSFSNGPKQDDPFIRLIGSIIRELRGVNIAFSLSSVKVMSSTSAPPIWPPSSYSEGHDVKFYTFQNNGEEFPSTVPVAVIPRVYPLTADKIHVRIKGEWKPIKDWLLGFDDDRCHWAYPIADFRRWWGRTGKTFRFMDLPIEIQMMICENLTSSGGEMYPLSTAARMFMGIGYSAKNRYRIPYWLLSHDLMDEDRAPVWPPHLNILFVCKAITEVALQASWEGTRKCFVDPLIFVTVADTRAGPILKYNCLSTVRLDFTNKAYFEFFGLKVEPLFHRDQSSSLGHYISGLTNLRDLQLRFRSPDDGYNSSPWKRISLWGDADSYTCCQRTMVDWIMTAAFPYVKHIAKVRIVGAVKDQEGK